MTKGMPVPQIADGAPKKGERYKHYKGDEYEVVGLALESSLDIWMVVYKPLYENADAELFTRPVSEWVEEVEWPTGPEGVEGERKRVRRFSLVKPAASR